MVRWDFTHGMRGAVRYARTNSQSTMASAWPTSQGQMTLHVEQRSMLPFVVGSLRSVTGV